MPSGGKGGKGGSSGQASNAALQDDEDVLNREWKGKHFREWASAVKKKRQQGPMVIYDKSPYPPKK